ncbi:MAG: hypothetical protein IPH16_04015 [Haliscomenobacter sp.]|nr:hypothetical protein [Haliscomenobacter sp.]MBK7475077.1 hypothetical protein [Haliscomenobacter sp.]MBK8879884.1 hypothetical protein [Haliscomenobacter sp.]
MNNPIIRQGLRLLFFLLFQVLLLKQIPLGPIGPFYADAFVYPLFLLLLPQRTSLELLLLLGFGIGLFVDMFYDSWGVHASASVFLAFIRPGMLRRLEPKGGYNLNYGLTIQRFSLTWFLRYAAIMMLFYLGFYYSMQVFSPVFFLEIVAKTALSFVTSLFFILILMLIFNPLD